MCSPANIASRRCGTPDSSASSKSKPHRLVGDPVLRVVQVDTLGLGCQPLAAPGIGREQLTQVTLANLGVVALEGLPRLALTKRRDGGH